MGVPSASVRADSRHSEEGDDRESRKMQFAFALIDDMQYSAQEDTKFLNLRDSINKENVAFVLHDGDFKSSSSLCSDALYLQRFELFQTFESPFVYVFGDNEWTDCHRTAAGAFDPLERLDKLRQIFTQGDQSLGKHTLRLDRQSKNPLFSKYRENVRWEYEGVMFVGLNVPGSNNNYPPYPPTLSAQQQEANGIESTRRNQANLAWLREAFTVAKQGDRRGILFFIQGNPFIFSPSNDKLTGYADFLALLESETRTFGKPVVLVHGDSHYFRIDKPLPQPAGGNPDGNRTPRLTNFTRVETFGSPDVHWVRGTVAEKNPDVFSFTPEIVDANR